MATVEWRPFESQLAEADLNNEVVYSFLYIDDEYMGIVGDRQRVKENEHNRALALPYGETEPVWFSNVEEAKTFMEVTCRIAPNEERSRI